MPDEKNNSSYNGCINRLHSRYEGRGTAVNVANELKQQTKNEVAAPNAYLVARMNKGTVSDKYKNGEFNGQKYMTTGDFLKYYNSRKAATPAVQPHRPSTQTKEFRKPAVRVEEKAVPRQAVQSAEAYHTRVNTAMKKYDPKADTIRMPAHKTQGKLKGRIASLVAKWFPQEEKNEKTAVYKKNMPVAMLGLLLTVSITMSVIVGTSLMVNDAETQVGDLKYEISQLKSEEAALSEELLRKDDLEMIEDYATEKLGMIKKDYVSAVYLDLGEGDSVNGSGEADGNMSAILSAMFGN